MTVQAFICVKAVPGNEDEVVHHLAEADRRKPKTFKIKGTKEVYRTTGDWDFVAIVEADSLKGISDIEARIQCLEKEGKPPGYIVSETMVLPRHPKQIGDP
jgi:DNA-binding Lrp family transcriptional regulator